MLTIISTTGSKVVQLEVTESFWEQYLNVVELSKTAMPPESWEGDWVYPEQFVQMSANIRKVCPDIFMKPLGAWEVK